MYTLIAYRPSASDSCMGCHMGSSDSEFEITYHNTVEEVATQSLKYRKSDFDDQDNREVADYELTILLNGVDVYNEHSVGEPIWTYVDGKSVEAKKYWQAQVDDAKALRQQQERNNQRESDLRELQRIKERLNSNY